MGIGTAELGLFVVCGGGLLGGLLIAAVIMAVYFYKRDAE